MCVQSHASSADVYSRDITLNDLQFHILMNVVYKESTSNCAIVK